MKSVWQGIGVAAYAAAARALPRDAASCCFLGEPGADNSLALFEHLLRERGDRYRHTWVVSDPASTTRAFQNSFDDWLRRGVVRVVAKRSAAGLRASLSAGHVFFTHGGYEVAGAVPGQTVVGLWHGMPLKRIALLNPKRRREPPYMDCTIATSPFFRTVMARCFDLPEEKVLLVGQPRNDWIVRPGVPALPFGFERRHFDSIVLWMPTYRRFRGPRGLWMDSSDDFQARVLEAASLEGLNRRLAAAGVLCLIKLHPLEELNEGEYPRLSNVAVIRNRDVEDGSFNVYRILGICDRLVSDLSSVFIDYALTGRPMGFFVPDLDEYLSERGLIEEVWKGIGLPGRRLEDADQFVEFLLGSLDPPPVDAAVLERLHAGCEAPYSEALLQRLGL